jgi:hypothetical protein
MQNFVTTASISIEQGQRVVFDFVTTPNNWKTAFPAIREVSGDVNEPSKAGYVWHEHIETETFQTRLTWTCQRAQAPALCEITSPDLFPGATTTLRYDLEAEGPGRTKFTRTMTVSLDPDSIPPGQATDIEQLGSSYLGAIKEALEE